MRDRTILTDLRLLAGREELTWPERHAALVESGVPTNLQEPSMYGLWGGKQTAKATENVAPAHRLIQVGGDFNPALDLGSEEYSDLSKFGAQTDWVNSLMGNGEPICEASPTELAWLLWMYHGAETVAAVVGPPTAQKHTFTPSTGRGWWGTFVRRMGQSLIQRHSYIDCLVTRLAIEGSTANKAVRVTPRVLSLDPAKTLAADPAQAMPTDKTFLYTDGTGAFTIDTVVIPGQSAFTFIVDDDISPVFGDDVLPFDIVQGNPTASLAVTLYFDSLALAEWNKLVYGTAAPAANTKPQKVVTPVGSYSFYLKQRDTAGALNGREFKLTVPSVRWNIPDAPAPNPGGGPTEIALSGELRPSGSPLYTIDVNTANGDIAFTA